MPISPASISRFVRHSFGRYARHIALMGKTGISVTQHIERILSAGAWMLHPKISGQCMYEAHIY